MKNRWKRMGLFSLICLGAVLLAVGLFLWGNELGYTTTAQKLSTWLQGMLLLLAVIFAPAIITTNRRIWAKNKAKQESLNPKEKPKTDIPEPFSELSAIRKHSRYRYGIFWRYRLKKILLIGHKDEVNALLPDLIAQTWLEGDKTLFIWGGEPEQEVNLAWLRALKKSIGRFGCRPLDAVVWVVSQDYASNSRQQSVQLENTLTQMRARHQALGWEIPLYLLQTQTTEWDQTERTTQSVGVYFTELTTQSLPSIISSLNALVKRCVARGMQQVLLDYRHTFLLELSQNLEQKQIPSIKPWLMRFMAIPHHPALRGLLFAPRPFKPHAQLDNPAHYCQSAELWQDMLTDCQTAKSRRLGTPWGMLACSFVMVVTLLTMVGFGVSYYHNYQLIEASKQLVNNLKQGSTESYATQLDNQYQLQLQLGQLMHRQAASLPIGYRFGLSRNDELLTALWPYYQQANQRNIAEPFGKLMADYLTLLTDIPPSDPRRVKLMDGAYDVLKAYLIISHADKSDGEYLSQFATRKWRAPEGVSEGDWQKLMPELVRFWGNAMASHPQWALNSDEQLVKNVRQLLIRQIGVQNAENTLYEAIILRASQHYGNLTLDQILAGVDSHALFSTDMEVAGVYTRKAWEEMIQDDIADAAKARQEQIDWVLSDGANTLTSSIAPDVLKQQLTERYFNDYSAEWILFLNTIQWHQAGNISDMIAQLTLLSDTRQSPLIALMNVVKYQSEVAYSGEGISDNLIRTAQALINHDKSQEVMAKTQEPQGPLTATFRPLLSLLQASNNSELSLQTYLLRVTQVRLKLQNITRSPSPQAMAQSMAKSVFQGTAIDLTDTRDYGNLIAASLGEEWSGFADSLFRQPLETSWQVVLTPAANSFNDVWQSQIVSNWEKSFSGRYPFKNSDNDASLAELARFLRPDSGVIDKFISRELGGVLHKQGDSWVIDPVNSQGLHFSAEFIDALNLLNELSNHLFASGDAKLAFDLMARSGGSVMRSELVIDKQKLGYFNQMPVWQRFSWPGEQYTPFAQLSWSTNETGLKLYDYYAGDWGLIRLLESANIKQLDSSRYQLVWRTLDENELKYILRTQSGEGPLLLLKLRNFKLPQTVFDVNSSDSL